MVIDRGPSRVSLIPYFWRRYYALNQILSLRTGHVLRLGLASPRVGMMKCHLVGTPLQMALVKWPYVGCHLPSIQLYNNLMLLF